MLRAGLAVLLAVILGGALAHAQAARGAQTNARQLWYQAYEAGVRDVARMAWDSAVQNLQAAKQSGPQPARRVVFYGDRIDVFNPDYYLGVAYLNLRRFADADAAFDRVQKADIIPANDKQYGTFQTQASTAKAEVAFAQATDYLAKGDLKLAAAAAEQAFQQTLRRPDINILGPVVARIKELQQQVARLQQSADAAATPSQAAATPAQSTAQAPVEQQPAPAPLPQPAPTAAQLPAPQPAPPQTQASAPAPAPRVLPPSAPVVALKAPVQRAPAAATSVSPATSERNGIAAFFTGRYDEAATTLAAIAAGPQGSARARFYLACSLAALVLTGDRDQSEMTAARARLREAGPLTQFTSDRRLISPRVLAALAIQP